MWGGSLEPEGRRRAQRDVTLARDSSRVLVPGPGWLSRTPTPANSFSFFFLIGGQVLYKVASVLTAQQSESAIPIHTSPLFGFPSL